MYLNGHCFALKIQREEYFYLIDQLTFNISKIFEYK